MVGRMVKARFRHRGRLEKSQVAQSAYLTHSWLMGHCVKMLPLHRIWARAGKPPLRMCLWWVVNVLDTNDHKDAAWGVWGRLHGVLQGDFLCNADCEGHHIQFSTALMGSACHRQLGGHMSTVAPCLSGHPHKILTYITRRRSGEMVAPLSTRELVDPSCEVCIMHIFTEAV